MGAWRPPPKLSLSEWADQYFYLSPESAAEPGRWHTLPYQKGIMDAFTDPAVTYIWVMKSARVGYTKILDAGIGYSIHQDPCPQLVVQPTIDDAKGFSKEEVAPMIRDCPVLSGIVHDDPDAENGPKDSGNTMLHKKYPGGVLSLVGANSGAGFRRVSRKRVFFDEVDAYPPSAGSDGDQIKLGIKRSEYYWDRKVMGGSTPLVAGSSRIEKLFKDGDQRRYYVPCPHCEHMDYLVFRRPESGQPGHWMQFDPDMPEHAHFVCSSCDEAIEHKHKRSMVERGEWRAHAPFSNTASFHIWTAYSYSPNATWADIAKEFLDANSKGPEELKTFVNTWLGETWVEKGDAPEWKRLHNQRETYQIGTVPAGVICLTAGVDVQKDRWVYEIVGWGTDKQSWSIDYGVIPGDTSNDADWLKLDQLLDRVIPGPLGEHWVVRMMAVDSGFNTQMVYNYARARVGRVVAVKGVDSLQSMVASPTPVDVTTGGKRIARGCKMWPVGSSVIKSELYGRLRLPVPETGHPYPSGFCHFPEYGEDYFKQLTAEQLVTQTTKDGYQKRVWQLLPGRENHALDARVYNRAAASVLGLDRMAPKVQPSQPQPQQPQPPTPTNPAPSQILTPDSRPGFLGRGNRGKSDMGRSRGAWLSKKR
jgi:phage terminase large subunit GpA-like protein